MDALVFDGYGAWPNPIALPAPHGNQILTCVWVKNNLLASAKTIYNVRMRIEYFHDGQPEFTINSAQWWHIVSGRAVQSISYIDLEANESQCVPVYMKPIGPTALSPPWPQSASDEHGGTRPLRLGRWKMRLTITADGSINPLVGEIEFTILQNLGEERPSIATTGELGAVRLPLRTEPKTTGHIRLIWALISGKWRWASLATAGIAVARAGEYAVGIGLFVLSGLAAVSKIAQWQPARSAKLFRFFGYLLVLVGFIFASLVALRMKGSDPWSHLQHATAPSMNPQLSLNQPTLPKEPTTNAKPPDKPDKPKEALPELVCMAPEENLYGFSWVPGVSLNISTLLAGKPEPPGLKFRNLSHEAISPINIHWHVPGPPVERVLLTNEHFKNHGPKREGDMIGFSSGPTYLAADTADTSIPYIADEPVDVAIPPTIWNSFQLKLIANTPRIDPHSERAHGLTKPVTAIAMQMDVTYGSGHRRKFVVTSETHVLPDNAWYGGVAVPSVPGQDWSADNLRADLRFFCRAE